MTVEDAFLLTPDLQFIDDVLGLCKGRERGEPR